MVTFPAATAQSEIQEHLFSRILVPNYESYETARDLARLSLLIFSVFTESSSRLLVFSLYLFLSI